MLKRKGCPVGRKHCAYPAGFGISGSSVIHSHYGYKRQVHRPGPPGNSVDDLSLKALAVQLSLAGDDQISTGSDLLKIEHIQDRLYARLELPSQKRDHSRPEASRGSGSFRLRDLSARFFLHEITQISESLIQRPDLRSISPFLRGKDKSRSVFTVHRVPDIADRRDTDTSQKRFSTRNIVFRDVRQSIPCRYEGIAVPVKEHSSESARASASRIIRRAAAKAKQYAGASADYRVLYQFSDPVCRRYARILSLSCQRQPRRRSHFYEGNITEHRIYSFCLFSQRTGDCPAYRQSPESAYETVDCSLPAVCDRKRQDLTVRKNRPYMLIADAAYLQARQSPFKGV